MALKIILTVGYWLYALITFLLSIKFVDNAPIRRTEGRKLVAISINIFSVGCGFLLTVLIWSN